MSTTNAQIALASSYLADCQTVQHELTSRLAAVSHRPAAYRGVCELRAAKLRADLAVRSATEGNYGLAANRLRQIDTTMACLGMVYRTPSHLQEDPLSPTYPMAMA